MNMREFLHGLAKAGPQIANVIIAQRDYDLRTKEMALREQEVGLGGREVAIREKTVGSNVAYNEALAGFYSTRDELDKQTIAFNAKYETTVDEYRRLSEQYYNAAENPKLQNQIEKKLNVAKSSLLAMQKDPNFGLLTPERNRNFNKASLILSQMNLITAMSKEDKELLAGMSEDSSPTEIANFIIENGSPDSRTAALDVKTMLMEASKAMLAARNGYRLAHPELSYRQYNDMIMGKGDVDLPSYMSELEQSGLLERSWYQKLLRINGESNEDWEKRKFKTYNEEYLPAYHRYINMNVAETGNATLDWLMNTMLELDQGKISFSDSMKAQRDQIEPPAGYTPPYQGGRY